MLHQFRQLAKHQVEIRSHGKFRERRFREQTELPQILHVFQRIGKIDCIARFFHLVAVLRKRHFYNEMRKPCPVTDSIDLVMRKFLLGTDTNAEFHMIRPEYPHGVMRKFHLSTADRPYFEWKIDHSR